MIRMVLFIAIALIQSASESADDHTEFFESRVRPLLITHCQKCHGGENSKGGLLLDTRNGWQQGGDSGAVIVPGNPEESLLIQAILYENADLAMPPDGKLPDSAIVVLREWIRLGAPDPRVAETRIGGMRSEDAKSWWAFQPISPSEPPLVESAEAVLQNGIDQFIQSRLDAVHLPAAPAADRRTLIRRATYDLTGLPPTPEEVKAFVEDVSPDAFSRVIDRLLQSRHYGERWGRHWLDVVRYADTAGENTDRPLPEMWRYRNWVFDALNRDLPLDEFTQLQLAGDLLRADTTGAQYSEGIVATGYLALARRFGHDSDKEKHLMHEDVIDNLGKAFLGLTLSCARCHDHKYDPFTMQDYYAIYGILDSSRFSFPGCEAKGAPRDLVPMLTAVDTEELKRPWHERRARIDASIAEVETAMQQISHTWRQQMQSSRRILAAADVEEGGTVELVDVATTALSGVEVRRGETLLLVVAPRGNHGADSTQIRWQISEVEGEQRHWNVQDLVSNLLLGNPHPGHSTSGAQWCLLDLRNGPAFLDERLDGYQNQGAISIWRRGETPSVFVNSSDQPVQVWTELPPKSFFVHPGADGPVAVAWISPMNGVVSIRGTVSDAHPAPGLDGVAFTLEHLADQEAGAGLAQLGQLSHERTAAVRRGDVEAGPEPVVPMAFAVVEGETRNARIQLQGDPEKPGEEMPRRWLEVLGGDEVPPNSGSGRRELAQWIAGNPLSTRVMVNRVWQAHFGRGLVRSVNDFGSRGDRPTHPELLEWLAARFEAEGRRLKPLHRLIMLSAAYQRSSTTESSTLQLDPDNRLLSRFERRRLSAEELRDSLLLVSGQLDRTPGHAHPFPSPATWTFTQHAPFNAVYDDTRRTAYQMVQRQRRHPFLALFDGADPNASTGLRQTTTVPTQALYFLNDPFFHAQAAALAESIQSQPDDAIRLRQLFMVTLQRVPDAADQTWAAEFLASYSGSIEEKWAACARVLLAGNEFLHID